MPKHKKASSSSDSDSGPDDASPPPKKQATLSKKKAEEDEQGWHLGNNRFVKVREFRGKVLIDIREFYEKDGELKPGKKGIALNAKQWKTFKDLVETIDQKVSDVA